MSDEDDSSDSTDDEDEDDESSSDSEEDDSSSSSDEEETDSDEDEDSDSDDSSESESSSESEDNNKRKKDKIKFNKKEQKKFEKDLALLLDGKVDEYISKNMPMDIPAMSDKDEHEDITFNRDLADRVNAEVRPHSLSIQIKDVDQLRDAIGDVENEDSEDEQPNNNLISPSPNEEEKIASPLDDTDTVGKARSKPQRRIDRIIRGSNKNLENIKRVLNQVQSDRHTPHKKREEAEREKEKDHAQMYAEANKHEEKRRLSQKLETIPSTAKVVNGNKDDGDNKNKFKGHLDDMIKNIMDGREFMPFPGDDKARQSNDDDDEDEKGIPTVNTNASFMENQVEYPSNDKPNVSPRKYGGRGVVPFRDASNYMDNKHETANIDLTEEDDDDIDRDDDALEALESEIKAAMEAQRNKIGGIGGRGMNGDDEDDEDVDEMFDDNTGDNNNNQLMGAQNRQSMENVMNGNNNDHQPSAEQFQSLIKTAIGPTAKGGHHKRQSTRLLLDSLRPSTSYGISPNGDADAGNFNLNLNEDLLNGTGSDDPNDNNIFNGVGHNDVSQKQILEDDPSQITRHITWGMILIELDNFDKLLEITQFETSELIEIIQNLIDESLEYQNQYVDHMTEGQFVLLTPVDIIITPQEIKTIENKIRNSMNNGNTSNVNIAEDEYFYEKKEDRLRDIAASVLQHLSQEEEGLEFCMGVALQDRVSSDQEWFEIARESLEEMKAYREFDRTRRRERQEKLLQATNQSSAFASSPSDEHIVDRLKRRSAKYTTNPRERTSVMGLFNAINMVSDLDYQDENGDTALTIACGSRRGLSNNGNDLGVLGGDSQDIDNMNAANINVVNAIIENGCNINLRNKEGMTALMYASMNGDEKVVERLCELNAKLEVKGITSKYTKTALLFAAENGHKKVVEILLKYGANINVICDNDQSNILMLCVNNNHIDLIKYLLTYNKENGGNLININQQNNFGNTSLMIAAYNGNEYVVQLLMNYGADINIKNDANDTAYSIARKNNHMQLCQLFLG